jgi:hypothetical protein
MSGRRIILCILLAGTALAFLLCNLTPPRRATPRPVKIVRDTNDIQEVQGRPAHVGYDPDFFKVNKVDAASY